MNDHETLKVIGNSAIQYAIFPLSGL